MFLQIDQKFDRILKVALSSFIFIFPLLYFRAFLYQGISSRAVVVFILIEILAVIFSIFLFNKDTKMFFVKSPIVFGLLSFLLAYFVCSIFGVDFSVSFWSKAARMSGIFFLLHAFLFYFFLEYLFVKDGVFRTKFLKIVIYSSVIYSVLSLLSPEGLNIIFKNLQTDGFTFGNSTFAGMYMFGALVLSLIYLFLTNQRKWWDFISPILILINPFFLNEKIWHLGLSGGITSIFGEAKASSYVAFSFIVFFFVVFTLSKIKKQKIIKYTGLLIFSLSLLSVSFVSVSILKEGGIVREVYMKEATSARPLVWELSWKAISEKPYFGWGPDNFDMAYNSHYDNRLLENRYGNEAWFDRAHNITIDQIVDMGYIGFSIYVLFYLTIFGSLCYVFLKNNDNKEKMVAVLLFGYFSFHILELQTAFETIPSIVMFLTFLALSSSLFFNTRNSLEKKDNVLIPEWLKNTKAVSILIFSILAFIFGTVPITRAEIANGTIRTIGDTHKRLPIYNGLFGSPVDLPSFIWRTSTDFQRGIASDSSILANPDKVAGLKKEIERFASEYESYIEKHPEDYRAMLNLADQYMYQSLFGGNEIQKAHDVLDRALLVSPENPQTYWMKSIAYLYQADFANARLWADKGIAVNPNIEQSHEVKDYIEKSIKEFPDVTLFFFRSV